MAFTRRYDEKTCAICANFIGENAVVSRDRHYYKINNVNGKCRAGGHACSLHKACPKFDPLPGFNA